MRKDRTKERVAEWQKIIAQIRRFERVLLTSGDMIASLVPSRRSKFVRPKSLTIAFERFGLDAKKSSHREMLLCVLAEITFGRKKGGRPRKSGKWNPRRLFELGIRREQLASEHRGISDKKAAAELKKRHPTDYKYDAEESVRRRLPEAKRKVEEAQRLLEPRPVRAATAIDSSGGILGNLLEKSARQNRLYN